MAPGRVATNRHVIAGAKYVTVVTPTGSHIAATGVTVDTKHDLALLSVPKLDLPPLPLGHSLSLAVGESVVAAGAPLGMTATVSEGIVSAERAVKGVSVIQNTAPISPGSSGGPLLDRKGLVVGYNSFFLLGGQNINFAHRIEHVSALIASNAKRSPLSTAAVLDGDPGAAVLGSDKPRSDTPAAQPYRDTLLTLAAQPSFGGARLLSQVLGRANLEKWNLDSGRVLFSLSREVVAGRNEKTAVLEESKRFVFDPTGIDISTTAGMRMSVAGYEAARTDELYLMFVVDIANIQFKDCDELEFGYRAARYTVSPAELDSYLRHYSVYGGLVTVALGHFASSFDKSELINHGAFVARAGEPSLQRFAKALTAQTQGQERLQRLINFVTDEIHLTDEAEDAMILKDAASILMTGETGRSGRAVLLASLLEQLHVPYVLVYAKSGLSLAVKSDRQFAPPKGSDFEWSSSTWALLDLSRPGFKIGSAPRVSTPTNSFFFVQNVSGDGALVDQHAGTVEFKTR